MTSARTLVAVGDSISWASRGWVHQLGRHIDMDVTMLAVPGAEAHSDVQQQLAALPERFGLGTLYFGSNDTRRRWDANRFEAALAAAARAMARRGPLLMPTVPRSLRPWPLNTRRRVIDANVIIRAVADQVGAAVVPLDSVPVLTYWTPDLVHPRPTGHRLICRRALTALHAVDTAFPPHP